MNYEEPSILTGNKPNYLLFSPFNPFPFYNTSRFPKSIGSNGDGGSILLKDRSQSPITRGVLINYKTSLSPQFDQRPPNGSFTRY